LTGVVFDIQRYSIHDGPGIRTVVFLKGCPLRCLWCCNPESQQAYPEVEFRERLCQHCGTCLSACPLGAINPDLWLTTGPKINLALCDNCGMCVERCPNGALRMVGQRRSVDEVLREVLRDAAYYRRSGGGVTLSGGEPMALPAFVTELLEACYQRNVHTAIETTGCVSWSLYEQVLPFTDLFLYDLKHVDCEAHRQLTGVPNTTILENARRLARAGASIILRVPLIPGCNLDDAHLSALADFAASLNVLEVHLMPFHQLGKDKYRRLSRSYRLGALRGLLEARDGPEKIRWAREIMARRGLEVFIGG
jgi:pyruvate formate lyase activating enzyme